MSDEGFHEIQLNGKQLVFLFMAATVVAVVIFLCGVMVGRGVPTRASSSVDATEQAILLDPTAAGQEDPIAPAIASSGNAPATAQETLTYPALLEDPNPPRETLQPPVDTVAAKPAPVAAPKPAAVASAPKPAVVALAPKPAAVVVAPKPAPVPAPAPQPVSPAVAGGLQASGADAPAGSLAEPSGAGFVVQVAAVRQRAEADTIARRLSTKGYPAFVTTAGANFRVRVGKYPDRREAESVAGRLEKEERFKPWITR